MSDYKSLIIPRRACAARVTIVVPCICVCLSILALQGTRRLMSDTNSFSGTWARRRKWRFCWNDCVRERQTATVVDSVAWPNPSISSAHASIRRDQRSMLAHLDLIRLLCVPWRHKKPQRRVCIDSRMLSTTVACPCQTLCELPRVNAYKPSPARRVCAVRRGFAL